MPHSYVTLDGNEAAARIAYATNEVIAIYPITPASPMGELSEQAHLHREDTGQNVAVGIDFGHDFDPKEASC